MIIKLVIMINLAEFIKIITTTTLINIDIYKKKNLNEIKYYLKNYFF